MEIFLKALEVSPIPENDKNILRKKYNNNLLLDVVKQLSIFDTSGEFLTLDNYTYYKSSPNSIIYFIKHQNLFITQEKKILFYSNFNLYSGNSIMNILKWLQNTYPYIQKLDLTKYHQITNIYPTISVMHWYLTYGHFKDEVYNLCDFYEKITKKTNKNYNCLKIVPNPTHDHKMKYLKTGTYNELCELLFDPNVLFNPLEFEEHVVFKLNDVLLIDDCLNTNTFHMFPKNVKEKIIKKIDYHPIYNEYVFISRGEAIHLPRNLTNQKEIETYFQTKNISVINPEIINLPTLINNISNVDNVIITWGGALVNLIYLKPNTNVYILKSKSYSNETLEFIFKFLKNYKLNINIINCDDKNEIDIKLLDKIIFK